MEQAFIRLDKDMPPSHMRSVATMDKDEGVIKVFNNGYYIYRCRDEVKNKEGWLTEKEIEDIIDRFKPFISK
jgi:hypothetical protein